MPAARTTRRLAAAAALPWGVLGVLRVTGAERGFPLVPAMAFAPQAAAGAVLPLAAAAAAGSRRGVVAAFAAGAAVAGPVLAVRRPVPTPVPDGERLRLATVSLRLGRVRPEPVLDLVRRYDVGVGGGLEPPAVRRHRRRPRELRATRRPPGPGERPGRGDRGRAHDASGGLAGTGPRVDRDLAALPPPDQGVLRVLAGDFNATLDHAALRAVLARGYVDAARATGRAGDWTWRPLRVPWPGLTLDHVLVDPRIGVAALAIAGVRGSDHRALVADLLLPR